MSKSLMHVRDLSCDRRITHSKANVAASTSLQTLVAAPTDGTRIAIMGIACVAGPTATDMTLFSGSTAISPLIANGANSGLVLPPVGIPWFVCLPNEPLKVTTGTGDDTGIQLITANISG